MDPNGWPAYPPALDQWQYAAAAFGMPPASFAGHPPPPPAGFDPLSGAQLPMSMKMDAVKHEYGPDAYGGSSEISSLYAAGAAASIGGAESNVASSASDYFANSLPTTVDANLSGGVGAYGDLSAGPSALLAGLGGPLGGGELSGVHNEEQLKAQQEAIRAHPLYPFLIVIFERCELATSTPRDLPKEPGSRSETAAEMFKDDLQAFKKTFNDNKNRFYTPDPELDKFMISAIQVLRLHLLELEKVHELCDHFCNRYVNTLKDSMQMDIAEAERTSSANEGPSSSGMGGSNSSPYAPPPPMPQQPAYEPQTVPLPESHHNVHLHSNVDPSISQPPGTSYEHQQQQAPSSTPHDLSGGTPAGTPSFHAMSQSNVPPSSAGSLGVGGSPRNGSTPRNGGTPHTATPGAQQPNAGAHDAVSDAGDGDSINGSLNEDGRDSVGSENGGHASGGSAGGGGGSLNSSGEHRAGSRRRVPKVFSKEAITKFRAWLFANLQHPYPSEEQKKQLANETGLTILQVNNWFINARRRIVQPMLDSANRAGRSPHCNVFKNRRRKNSDHSPSPGLNTAELTNGGLGEAAGVAGGVASSLPLAYSPDNPAMMPAGAVNVSQYPAAMFPPVYGFNPAGFTTAPMFGVLPGYPAPTGMTSDWMGSFGTMDN
ncbi:Homeobox domain-containing protein [Aphelenchoides fujianensis]|nr:Homeobox domain-containing protein [Aphelenchoides fujianensis]